MDNVISVLSMNCQGLGNSIKRRDVFHYIRSKDFSVYFLQDTHIEPNLEKYVLAEWGYKAYFSAGRSNSRGVAILFKNNFEFKVKKVYKDTDGNYIIVHVSIKNDDFLLFNA